MGKISSRKRLLTLMEMFTEYTDEEHQLSLKDIQSELRSMLGSDDEVKGDILREDINEIDESACST